MEFENTEEDEYVCTPQKVNNKYILEKYWSQENFLGDKQHTIPPGLI